MITTTDVISELRPSEARRDSSFDLRTVGEVELKPETHQFLVDEADAVGMSIGEYAAAFIEEYAALRFPARDSDHEVV